MPKALVPFKVMNDCYPKADLQVQPGYFGFVRSHSSHWRRPGIAAVLIRLVPICGSLRANVRRLRASHTVASEPGS